MDGLIIFALAIYLAFKTAKEKIDTPKLEVKKNPDFYKDENAFMDLHNSILGEKK